MSTNGIEHAGHLARIAELENALALQRRNYMDLYTAVIGEGTITAMLHDPVVIAKAQREDAALLEWIIAKGNFIEVGHHDVACDRASINEARANYVGK